MDEDWPAPFVIDNGSYMIKTGMAGDDDPHLYTRNMMYRGSNQLVDSGYNSPLDENALVSDVIKPMNRGVIQDYDAMTLIWDKVFSREENNNNGVQENIDSNWRSESAILIQSIYMNDKERGGRKQWEKCLEIWFERYTLENMFMVLQDLVSVYSSGRTTGLSVTIGEGLITTCPMYYGSIIQHAVNTVPIGGMDITEMLKRILKSRESTHPIQSILSQNKVIFEYSHIHEAKKAMARVAYDWNASASVPFTPTPTTESPPPSQSYTLPDGIQISVTGLESISLGEVLFQPWVGEVESPLGGIHDLIEWSINSCDRSIYRDLCGNIIVSGWTTMIPGLGDRLYQQLVPLFQTNYIRPILPPERLKSAWIGGSILGSLSVFNDIMINRSEYQDSGTKILYKCNV